MYKGTLMGTVHHCIVSIPVDVLKELFARAVCIADGSAVPMQIYCFSDVPLGENQPLTEQQNLETNLTPCSGKLHSEANFPPERRVVIHS